MRCIGTLYFRLSAFTELKRYRCFMPISLFHAPTLIAAERWFQIGFLGVDAYLLHNKGKLAQIAGTRLFQILNLTKSPILIFLPWQHSYIHQHICRSRISTDLALMVNCRMNPSDHLFFCHNFRHSSLPEHIQRQKNCPVKVDILLVFTYNEYRKKHCDKRLASD